MTAKSASFTRLLETARTADLYDLIAATLNTLAERGEELTFGPVGIDTRYAFISPDKDSGGEFVATYFAEASAELAMEERGAAR